MARNSLSVDEDGLGVAANGTTGYFVVSHIVEKLIVAPWETIIGPKVIVEWSK